jgi:hypothetical protein
MSIAIKDATGTTQTVKGDVVSTEHVQFVKLDVGATGAASPVTSSNPLPVSGPLTDAQIRATALPVSGPLTDAQIRATALPVSGPLTDTQIRATALPVSIAAAVAVTNADLATLAGAVKAEDSAAADGHSGLAILAQRRDADTSAAGADGDYSFLNVDEVGRLKVSTQAASYAAITGNITANGGTVFCSCERFSNLMIHCTGTFSTVNVTFEGSLNSTNGSDGTWFTVQAIRSNANTIETTTGNLSAAPAYAWELSVNGLKYFRVRATAWTSGTQAWTMVPGTYATEPIPGAQVSGTQAVSGTVTANQGTFTAPSATFLTTTASTNAGFSKASAGTVYSIGISNPTGSTVYVKLFNKTSAPTVGTDVPVLSFPVAAGASLAFPFGATGQRFGTGIAHCVTGGAADSDTSNAAAGAKVALSWI